MLRHFFASDFCLCHFLYSFLCWLALLLVYQISFVLYGPERFSNNGTTVWLLSSKQRNMKLLRFLLVDSDRLLSSCVKRRSSWLFACSCYFQTWVFFVHTVFTRFVRTCSQYSKGGSVSFQTTKIEALWAKKGILKTWRCHSLDRFLDDLIRWKNLK